MRTLKDTIKDAILEKLKVDDIVVDDEFPIDGIFDDMIKFLEEEGFHYIDGSIVKKAFNTAKSKCYMLDSVSMWFADTSKGEISKNNPIFYIIHYSEAYEYRVYYIDNSDEVIDIVKDDKKAFLKELNKRFGW